MGFIDADTHVIECDETWNYLDPTERHYRPVQWELPEIGTDGHQCGVAKSLWVIADTWARRHTSDGRPGGVGKEFNGDVSHLLDVSRRLDDMDKLSVDVQLVISSFFIGIELEHALAEAALCRSFNRWLADRTSDARGRLPWLVVPPTRMMDRALQELEFGKANGAVGVMLKGQEHGMFLDDPYFYPLYAKAQELDLALCVHAGTSVRRLNNQPLGNLLPTSAAFVDHFGTVIKGFWAVLTSDFHKRFPALRWAFLETGSTWVPLVFQQQMRLDATSSDEGFYETRLGTAVRFPNPRTVELLAEKKMYVACESDEDIPYITKFVGADRLVFGSDYCHNDVGSDPLGHHSLANRVDIPDADADLILDRNARTLLGISDSFRPVATVDTDISPVPA